MQGGGIGATFPKADVCATLAVLDSGLRWVLDGNYSTASVCRNSALVCFKPSFLLLVASPTSIDCYYVTSTSFEVWISAPRFS